MPDKTAKTIRLNKFIARCGLASRRGADELVASGRVRVNDKPAQSGTQVDPMSDRVEVDGKLLSLPLDKPRMFLLNKPTQTVTTVRDPQGRKTVMDLLPVEIRKLRPYPVGRLDYFSEGLLLITTDGELCNQLTHPRHHLKKIYLVQVKEEVSEKSLETMRTGMTLAEGERLAPVEVEAKVGFRGATTLILTLTQGINRQIRRMCRDLGLTIIKLKRVQQGPLKLKDLQPGQFRELTDQELHDLHKEASLA